MLATAYPSQSFMSSNFNNKQQGMHTQNPVSYSSSMSPQLDHSLLYTNNWSGMCAWITSECWVFFNTTSQATVANNALWQRALPIAFATTCLGILINTRCSRIQRKTVAGLRIIAFVRKEVPTSGRHLPSITLRCTFLLPWRDPLVSCTGTHNSSVIRGLSRTQTQSTLYEVTALNGTVMTYASAHCHRPLQSWTISCSLAPQILLYTLSPLDRHWFSRLEFMICHISRHLLYPQPWCPETHLLRLLHLIPGEQVWMVPQKGKNAPIAMQLPHPCGAENPLLWSRFAMLAVSIYNKGTDIAQRNSLMPIKTTMRVKKRTKTITVPSVVIVIHTQLRFGVGVKVGLRYAMHVASTRDFVEKIGQCHWNERRSNPAPSTPRSLPLCLRPLHNHEIWTLTPWL